MMGKEDEKKADIPTVCLLRIAFDTLGPREARVLAFRAAILSWTERLFAAVVGGGALAIFSMALSRHLAAVRQPNVF